MHDAQLSGTVQTYYTVFLQKCQEPFDIVEKLKSLLKKKLISATMVPVIILKETIFLDSGILTYEFVRKNIKNINLRIKCDGSVHVSVPRTVTKNEAEAFICQKEAFIRAAQAKFAAFPATKENEPFLTNGTVIPILGEPKTVSLFTTVLYESVSIAGDTLAIAVRPNAKPEHAVFLLESYLKRECTAKITAVCRRAFPRFAAVKPDLIFPKITVRRMTSRYGSCNASKCAVTFNTVLYHMPESLMEYVVCHEFSHFFVQNHSEAFYRRLSYFLPDWQERKQGLAFFCSKYPQIWEL